MTRLAAVLRLLPLVTALACRGAETDTSPVASGELSLPRGFDEPLDEASWRNGDAVSYRVRLERGEEREEWGLSFSCGGLDREQRGFLEYTADGESRSTPLGETVQVVSTVRESGRRGLGTSLVQLPSGLLEAGLYPMCELLADLTVAEREELIASEARDLDPALAARRADVVEATLIGVSTLEQVVTVLRDDPVLSDVLWAVLEKPPLLSLIATGGRVDVTIHANWTRVRPAEFRSGDRVLPAHFVPLGISVNGHRALEAELTIVRPVPPYHMAGGLARLVGRSPKRDDVRVVLELESARLGKQRL